MNKYIDLITTSNYNYDNHKKYSFTLVNGKKAQNLYKSHKQSINYYGFRGLEDCYYRPSKTKENAYKYCLSMALNYQSNDYTITGFNTCQFSFSFTFKHDGKLYLAYITKDYNYLVLSEFLG